MDINNTLPSAVSLQYAEDLVVTLTKEMYLDERAVSLAKGLVSKHLPPLISPDVLAFIFGVSKQYIYYLADSENQYDVYEVQKPGGGKRQIEAPRRYLKLVQRWINNHVLRTHQFPPFVTGFVPGRSIFENAKPHLANKNLMVVDIEDFFPSVKSGKIYKIFRSFGYGRGVANLLTSLCTYNSRLPQGAPTSPSLANIAFLPVDRRLNDLAETWGCSYSRYADDIAFSGNLRFSGEHNERVKEVLRSARFKANERKTRIVGSGGRQMLAGLVVNSAGLPPRRKRRQWRAMFHQASLDPATCAEESSYLRGVAAFVKEYNAALSRKYAEIAAKAESLEA